MPQYLMNVIQPDGPPPEAAILDPILEQLALLRQDMKDAGAWVFSAGLHPPSTATVLRPEDGQVLMTDGPFAEGHEHIGGFTVVEAADLDDALRWGRRMAEVITLPIEVRPMAPESH
jgi:hypothetical protein